MATTMEQRAKFRELRLSGTTREDAMKQAYGDIMPVSPTPTAPVNPPATPPTQTPPQTVAWVNGEQFAVAPVNPNTGLSQPATPAPVAPTPVAPVKETIATTPTEAQINQAREVAKSITPVKTEAPKDETATIKAQTDSQMAINKQNADLKEQERQRIAEETRIANTPKSASEMYNLITTKTPISEELKATWAYRVANNRYQRANMYAEMTPAELSKAVTDSKLIQWSQAWEDLKTMNPKLMEDLKNLRIVNGEKTNIWTYKNNPDGTPVKDENWNPVKTNNLEKQFSSDYLDDYGDFLREIYKVDSPETINSKIRTQAVVDAEAKATEYETELNAIEKDINAIEKDVDKELSGSGATGSRARLEKIARKEALQSEYNSVLKSYTMYANKANDLIKNNTENYKTSKEQENKLTSALATAAGEKYKNELALAQNQAEYDQKIAQQAQAMETPELAIPSVIDEYAQLWVMAQKSAQQHIADAKAFIAKWGTLGEYISQMQKDFQWKESYKAKFAPKATENFELKEIGGKTYKFNQATGQYEVLSGGTTSSYLDVPRTWNNVWQDTNNPWNIMGDTEAQRNIALGYGAVWFYKSPNGRTYAVFPDMDSWVKASMADLQAKLSGGSSWATPNTSLEKFASGWVSWPNAPINQNAVENYVKLTGYPKNTPISQIPMDVLAKAVFANEGVDISKSANLAGVQGTGTQPSQYNDQNIADLAYLVELQEKNPTQASKDMKELGYTARDIANYKAGNVPLTDRQKQTSVSLIDDIKDLVSNYDWNDATGVHFGMPVIAWTDRADTLQKIDQLVAKMTLPNLGSLKWPMSDKDLAFITKASSNLSAELSDAQFEKNLVQAYNVAARRAGLPEVNTINEIKWVAQPAQATVGWEKLYSKYE